MQREPVSISSAAAGVPAPLFILLSCSYQGLNYYTSGLVWHEGITAPLSAFSVLTERVLAGVGGFLQPWDVERQNHLCPRSASGVAQCAHPLPYHTPELLSDFTSKGIWAHAWPQLGKNNSEALSLMCYSFSYLVYQGQNFLFFLILSTDQKESGSHICRLPFRDPAFICIHTTVMLAACSWENFCLQ